MINYKNLFFKTGNPSIKNFGFLKDMVHCLTYLIDLLNEKISINEAKQEQEEMIDKINELKNFILLEKESIKKKKKTESIIKKEKNKTQTSNFCNTKVL